MPKKIASELLNRDKDLDDAKVAKKLAIIKENLPADLLAGKFRDVMEEIPSSLPARGNAIKQKIEEEVKLEWLAHAKKLNGEMEYKKAQEYLVELTTFFKKDEEGNKLLEATFKEYFKELYSQKKFETAWDLLKITGFRFPGLVEEVKQTWRDGEIARFDGGDIGEKEAAVKGLSKLSSQFGSDNLLQKKYEQYRSKYVDAALGQIDNNLTGKRYSQAREQADRVKEYAKGPQEAQLKLRHLRSLIENPIATEADHQLIKSLLSDVMKQAPSESELKTVAESIVKIAGVYPQFTNGIEPEMHKLRGIFKDRAPVGFDQLVKDYAPPVNSGSAKEMSLANTLYNSGEFGKSLQALRQIEAKNDNDASTRRDYYELLGKLGERVSLDRADVYELKKASLAQRDIKVNVSKVMSQSIKSWWKTEPQKPETWQSRIEDADLADLEQPLVLAYKAEALLELGKGVEFDLPPGEQEEKNYITYVQAFAGLKKKGGAIGAAGTLEKIAPSEPWLASSPNRRERIAGILQNAAVLLAKPTDSSPFSFASVANANKAYGWLEKAMQFSETAKNGLSLPWEAELTLALAAACKVPPKLELVKALGADLLKRRRDKLAEPDRINLVLSSPAGFADELKSLKSDKIVRLEQVSGILEVGDAQIDDAADNLELKQRQAQLYSLKGWILEQAAPQDNDEIFNAYSRASKLDPDSDEILLAKGRFGAISKLVAAKKENNPSAKVDILTQGVNACKAALRKNLDNDESWADLCLQRSQLGLELGNAYNSLKQPDELQSSFNDARVYAEKALKAKIPHKKPADVWLALGNAFEDLGQFVRVDKSKNFAEAAKAFSEAAKLESDYQFNLGRAQFRWGADDEANRTPLLNKAIVNLAPMAISKKPFAAEASYWEGCCYWFLDLVSFTKAPEAVRAFERCMAIAENNDEAAIWAKYSLDGALACATGYKADLDRSLKWVENLERVYGRHKNNFHFKGVERPLSDATAEVTWELAKKAVAAKDLSKSKTYSERAFQAKHSTIGHEIAVFRAGVLKFNKTKLNLAPANLTAIYMETIAAIDSSTTLSPAEKKTAREVFNKEWNAIK